MHVLTSGLIFRHFILLKHPLSRPTPFSAHLGLDRYRLTTPKDTYRQAFGVVMCRISVCVRSAFGLAADPGAITDKTQIKVIHAAAAASAAIFSHR